MTEKLNELVVDGKTYSLSVAPDYNDALVQKEVKSVLVSLDLNDITENLYLSVELLYVAYNGVAGAQQGKIQAEIFEIQSKLALLCNDCIKTMSSFETETRNIIDMLVQTHRWLIKGNEKMALKKLSHCSESSQKMSTKAKFLGEEFKKLQISSTKAKSNTIKEEASENDRKLAAEKAERDLIAQQKAEDTNQKELIEQISNMEVLYKEAKEREESESTKALVLGITSAVTGAIGAGLGAYMTASNPVAALSSNISSSSVKSADIEPIQKNLDDKKKISDEVQSKLLLAEDEQTSKKNKKNTLEKELDELQNNIKNKELDENTKQEDLVALKEQRDIKQGEYNTAKQELTKSGRGVDKLKSEARDATAGYAAAGAALQDVAQKTDQMAQAAITAEASIHKEKMKFLTKKMALEKEKRVSLVALAEYAETTKNLQQEAGMAEISVNSLHSAIAALGKVIGTLTNASLFWDQMSTYCDRMTTEGFQQELRDLNDPSMGLTQAERVEEYSTPSFMGLFLKYMCQWVAINGLSGDYLVSASEAQKKAVEYLKQSPTIEEALRSAPELARNMGIIVSNSLKKSREVSIDLEQQKALIEEKTA